MATLDVVITLSSAGANTGPFTITDNGNNTLATGVTRAQLLAGYRLYINSAYPNLTATSTGSCTTSRSVSYNYVAPTYYYYTVSKFDCNNSCAQVGSNGAFAAISTTALTTGQHYYSGGYSWRPETTLSPAPTSYNVDLSNKTANASCSGCQPVASPQNFYFAQEVADSSLATSYCSAQGFLVNQEVFADNAIITPGSTRFYYNQALTNPYVGNHTSGTPFRIAFITATQYTTSGALNTNNASGYSYVRIDSSGFVQGMGTHICTGGSGGSEF